MPHLDGMLNAVLLPYGFAAVVVIVLLVIVATVRREIRDSRVRPRGTLVDACAQARVGVSDSATPVERQSPKLHWRASRPQLLGFVLLVATFEMVRWARDLRISELVSPEHSVGDLLGMEARDLVLSVLLGAAIGLACGSVVVRLFAGRCFVISRRAFYVRMLASGLLPASACTCLLAADVVRSSYSYWATLPLAVALGALVLVWSSHYVDEAAHSPG